MPDRPLSRCAVPVYIAGPFFNPEQVACVERIEKLLTGLGIEFVSPRLQHKGGGTKIDSSVKAQQAFQINLVGLKVCKTVLAVTDFLLPENHSLRVWEKSTKLALGGALIGPEIKIPDSGTVWELGFGYALSKSLIIFTADPSSRLNIMLTQCAKGVIYGWKHLENYFKGEQLLSKWEGSFV